MKIPDWWQAILLFSAAWRTFQLLAYDDILDRPRRALLHLGDLWQKEGDPIPPDYRITLGNFINCPYCLGFWLAFGWWVAFQIFPHGSLIAATPLALSAGVVILAKALHEE